MAKTTEIVRPVHIENLNPAIRLNIRSEEETQAIEEIALRYSDGDRDRARLLLRKTNFVINGYLLGKSLFVAGPSEKLPRVADVISRMAMIDILSQEEWNEHLITMVMMGIQTRPYDLVLFGAMLNDLGGETAIAKFMNEVAIPNQIPFTEKTVHGAVDVYEEMVGRSVWELEESLLISMLFRARAAWEVGMEAFGVDDQAEIWEAETDRLAMNLRRFMGDGGMRLRMELIENEWTVTDDNARLFVELPNSIRYDQNDLLMDARTRMRELAAVVLARGIVQKGKGIMARDNNDEKITYWNLLSYLD